MNSTEEIKSIMDSPILNLINTMRYSGIPLIKAEAVSDHVWGMITLALEIVPRINRLIGEDKTPIDLKEVIYRISIHDIDEALGSDIPRPFKYYTQDFRDKIEEVTTMMLRDRFESEFVNDILDAKNTSIEGRIVAVLDLMQSGTKMRYEVLMGNQFIKNEIPNVTESLNELAASSLNAIKEYSEDAYDYLHNLIYYFIVELNSLL